MGARMRIRAVMMTSIAFIARPDPAGLGDRCRDAQPAGVGTAVFAGMIFASSSASS